MTHFRHRLSFFFLFFVVTAIAGDTYTGRVVDSETSDGLSEVTITLSGSTENWLTDADGNFSFFSGVAVSAPRNSYTGRTFVKLSAGGRLLDLSAAYGAVSATLYNANGERLYYGKSADGAALLKLPALSMGIYILHITMSDNRDIVFNWVHTQAYGAVFETGGAARSGVSRFAMQTQKIGVMTFEKNGYQKKEVDIESDGLRTGMVIKMKPAIGSAVFGDSVVRAYRLTISENDMATLLDYGNLVPDKYTVNAVFVPARFECEGRVLDSIAVRFRGDQSLTDCVSNGSRRKGVSYPQFGFGSGDICAKFSMKFDFNRYNADNRFYGLKALNFRSMSADPTKMREMLGYSVYDDMDIPVPRSGWARLYVNDSLWGVYGLAEEIDGRFTKAHFPETGDGNLYKDVWPATHFSDNEIRDALETNNDPEDNPDVSDFKEFRDIVVAGETTEENFLEKIGGVVDVAHLLRYIIADRAIMNFDGIVAAYSGGDLRHNYCWYHDEESGLFRLIPWDLDKVFIYPEPNFWTNNQPVGDNLVPNWNVVNSDYTDIICVFDPAHWGSYKTSPIDKDKFLRFFRNTTWNDFRSLCSVFLDAVFTEERLNERIDKWRSLLAGPVGEDKTIDSSEWVVMVDSLSRTIPLFRTNLKLMADTLIIK